MSLPKLIAAVPARAVPSRARALAALLSIGLLAAGCGGGGDPPEADATPGADESRLEALGTDASAEGTVTPLAWTTIANEGQSFTVSGTQTVRFGTGSTWVTKTVTGTGQCTNAFFGRDPAVGKGKVCQIDPSAPPPVTTWTRIAGEGQSFTVSGTQTVRFGTGSTWVTKSVTGTGQCTNAFFGSDPAVGRGKECQVASTAAPPPPTTWVRIAIEGQSFTVSGTQTVRFGSGTRWVTKSVTNGGQCTNAFFGSDPAVGVGKECQVASGAAPPPPPAAVCTPPVTAVDTSSTAASVGTGTAASCTESALRAAIASKSTVTFNCGAAPVTIPIAAQIDLPIDRNLVIDGGSKVTLDGGSRTRIFNLVRQNYRTSTLGLTLQHITLANAKAPGTGYVPQDPTRPQCAWGYAGGAGAAIYVRDARLHAIDVEFRNNAAASPGPDVGGGAIYALGSLDVTVVGSRFTGNSGSNAGAVGLLQSNGRFVNSTFDGNSATGQGQNYVDASCPGIGHSGQAGAGGNSGAIGIDGADDTDQLVCGSRFTNNKANELAGALGRTVNGTPHKTTIDRTTFDGNKARQAGAVFVTNSRPMEILASTFSNNSARAFGGAQLERSLLKIENSTFAGNAATSGVGGALQLNGNDAASSLRNATFANNKALAGSGYFSAAIFGQLNFPVNNTVFSNNVTNDGGSPMQCTFTPTTGAANVQWPRNHVLGGSPDTLCVQGIVFADPLLGALAGNGGPTQTLLPASNSPLRGAGRNCPATDQRGHPRSAASCTVGAVE